MKTNKYILTLALTVCCALGNVYAINSSYYSSIDGKKDSGLREALTTLLYNNHTKGLSYDWDFDGIDWDNSGNVYDIYSDCGHKKTDATSPYQCCCDAINREHVVPQSTFDSKYPQYADRHHLFVVDGKVNGYRSNYAFGECSSGTKGSCNNSSTVKPSEGKASCSNHEFGKLGTSTFTEVKISDKVYEPDDEYKGDIARAIMYMVVRYATADYCKVKSGNGSSSTNAYPVTAWSASSNCGLMFSSSLSTNYGLSNYGKALLLKWHRNDPVSAREIARNEGVAAKQGNRNPFIDYPCLAEYLWGNKAGETVTLSSLVGTFSGSWTTGDGCPCGDDPAITLPTGDIFVGSTEANSSVTKTITVQGVNLTDNLSLAISGTNSSLFSLDATTILKASAEAGSSVTITYRPTAAGNHSATLTISGGGLASDQTFALSGTCCDPYLVTLSRNGITETVGACGTYTLPTAEDEAETCDGWEFQGWVTSGTSFTEGQTYAPTFITEVSSATTLYAVYGKTETSSAPRRAKAATATWTKVTDASTLKSGDVLVIASCDNAVTAGDINSQVMVNVSSTFSSDKSTITSLGSGTIELTLGGSSGSWTLSSTSGALGATAAKKLSWSSGTTTWSISISSGNATITNETSSYGSLKYNTQSPRFTTYTSGQADVQLYRKDGGSTSTTTYKKLPCTTYTISYVDEDGIATGGSYQASETTALAGTTISLDYDEAMGYEFTGWTVTNVSTSATITVSNGQFTMPEANVTVQANFNALCSKLSAPDVTATPGDGQITLTWEDVTGADHYTVSIGKGEGYTTECSYPTVGNITHSSTTNTCVITGLTNGLEYTTSVVANGVSSICDSDADEDTATPTVVVPTEVIVSFNANGGTGTMSDQTIPYNEATALDANTFSRTGYTFLGWATVQGGDKAYNDGASVTLTEDITLYAVWQINSHNVTFTPSPTGATVTVNSQSTSPQSVNYNTTVTVAVTPAAHYTLTGITLSTGGTVTINGNSGTFTMPDEDVTVAVEMTEDTKYTVNWYVNGTSQKAEENYAGEALVGITAPEIDCYGKIFQGWTETANYSSEDTAPSDLFTDASTKTMPSNNNTSYYAVFATVEETTTDGESSSIVDELTRETTGITGTSYSEWSGKSGTSGAVYAGQSAGGNSSIQLRSTSPSGIITTTSGGKATKVIVEWESNTADDRTLNVYGKSSAYAEPKDLYSSSTQGTLIGTIVKGKSTELTINNDYEYIGLRSASGAMYLTSVSITWSSTSASTTTTTISGYTTSCSAPAKVTVTFNANGGEGTMDAQEIDYNTATALTANTFTRTGYSFAGWATSATGSKAYDDEEPVTLTKNMTLYALWSKNNYNVIFTPSITGQATITVNGASTSPQTAEFESTVTIAVTPNEAYMVDEVSVSGNISVTDNGDNTYTFTMPASDVTVTVNMAAKPTYTIRFIDNGSIISTQTVYEGDLASKPEDPTPCNDYTFVGWWTAEIDPATATAETWVTNFTATDDQDYYAVYSYEQSANAPVRRALSKATSISTGDKVVFVCENVVKEMTSISSTSTPYGIGSDYTGTPAGTFEFEVVTGYSTGTLAFKNGNNYLNWSSGNSLNVNGTLSDNTSWKVEIDASGNATIKNANDENRVIWWNVSSPRFACYTDKTAGASYNNIQLYKNSSSGTTYYTTAPDCEAPIVTSAKMLVAEYGGARVALAHDNTNTVAALPLMYFKETYLCPNKDKNGNTVSAPEKATLTWQVAERTDGYYIKSGGQFLAATANGFTLTDQRFLWSKDGGTRLAYDATTEKFIADQQGELPGITPVNIPSSISLTELKSQRDLTKGNFGTICLPHAVALPFTWGIRVYSIEAKKMNDKDELSGIYIVEETEMLTAGKPYLIEAKETQMTMWYPTGAETVTETVPALGLVGNLGTKPVYVPVDCYGISNNQLRRVAAENTATIGQYKAYIDLTDVPVEGVGISMQSMYKVLYTAEGENVATGTEQLSDPAGINWNEPVYNILGIRVDRNCTGVLIQNGKKFLVTHPRP